MKTRDARAMLAPGSAWGTRATWVDLGCGTGTFTLALAELLGAGSMIIAIDLDADALAALPRNHRNVQIDIRQHDLETFELPVSLDGVLLANSLHYVRAQATLLLRVARALGPAGRCLVVEYDTEKPLPPWVPFPVSQSTARTLLRQAGLTVIEQLATRPSIYRRAALYSLQARSGSGLPATFGQARDDGPRAAQ
jgi:SAM-dependent methyltransferase